MITKEQIQNLVEQYLKDTDYQLQTLEIDKDNNILVEIDRLGVVDVDDCAALNRFLVEQLGDEDYALEVGSVSLTAPFKSKIQYQKNLGHNVVVTDADGKKHSGQLVSVDEQTFQVDAEQTYTFRYDEVRSVIYNLKV
ncbi:MAG: ribosome assembly cofactor RimP [Paludibacteraceae bacterium]|nr:ribosome assembly cofactor RimP [Paludibacteraceae bacterium]